MHPVQHTRPFNVTRLTNGTGTACAFTQGTSVQFIEAVNARGESPNRCIDDRGIAPLAMMVRSAPQVMEPALTACHDFIQGVIVTAANAEQHIEPPGSSLQDAYKMRSYALAHMNTAKTKPHFNDIRLISSAFLIPATQYAKFRSGDHQHHRVEPRRLCFCQ